MNYARIYSEFIADRLTKQPVKPDYFERHHIKPRCLGGGDEPENMIRLTPEDHLFAHILLAWIHGWKLWSAVFLMKSADRPTGDYKRRIDRHHRVVYGIARRRHAEIERGKDGLKGADNGNYNPEVLRWRNLDTSDRRAATLHEMWAEFGGSRGMWTQAATPGSGKPSSRGWAIDDGLPRLRSGKGKVFEFINRDGRTFRGTQGEFCSYIGVSLASGSRVARHKSVTACGWRLVGIEDRPHTAMKSTGKPAKAGSGKVYTAEKDGVLHHGSCGILARKLGSSTQQFHAGVGQIAQGRMRTYKGWRIQWQEKLL